MIAGLASNIYNRTFLMKHIDLSLPSRVRNYDEILLFLAAVSEIESDLHASSSDISLSLSLFILIQGTTPIVWSALSEIKGRKVCDRCPIDIFLARLHHLYLIMSVFPFRLCTSSLLALA